MSNTKPSNTKPNNTKLNNLKRIRKERKVTQSDLADALDVTEVTISRYETGFSKLPVEKAKKIAVILGCNWWELYD